MTRVRYFSSFFSSFFFASSFFGSSFFFGSTTSITTGAGVTA